MKNFKVGGNIFSLVESIQNLEGAESIMKLVQNTIESAFPENDVQRKVEHIRRQLVHLISDMRAEVGRIGAVTRDLEEGVDVSAKVANQP